MGTKVNPFTNQIDAFGIIGKVGVYFSDDYEENLLQGILKHPQVPGFCILLIVLSLSVIAMNIYYYYITLKTQNNTIELDDQKPKNSS